jgi:hypothetical protein
MSKANLKNKIQFTQQTKCWTALIDKYHFIQKKQPITCIFNPLNF